jgi:hypothetical protein
MTFPSLSVFSNRVIESITRLIFKPMIVKALYLLKKKKIVKALCIYDKMDQL